MTTAILTVERRYGVLPGAPLSARELEIVVGVADGLTSAEIARRLVLSPLSVKSHLARIGVKLGTSHRAGIVAAAYLTGQLARRPLPAGFVVPPWSRADHELVALLARGLLDREIAGRFCVAEDTVGSRVKRLFVAWGVGSRAALVSRVVDAGVLRLVPRGAPGAPGGVRDGA